MDQEKAQRILGKYSPMPDDEQLTEEIGGYDGFFNVGRMVGLCRKSCSVVL